MKKPKWIWDGVKILAGLAASMTLQFSKAADRPAAGYTPPGPPDPARMLPVVMGVSQADWVATSVWAGTLAALVVAADGVWGLIQAKLGKIDEENKKDINRAILSVLKALSENTGINIVYLGGSVFQYKKTWKSFKLKTLVRYRLDDYPAASDIKWNGAKGAIGIAAETRDVVHCDWVKASNQLNAGEDFLSALPHEQRFGFSNDELRQMVGKYYESLATPIKSEDGSKLLGILAIDIPNRSDVQREQAVLGERDVREVLTVPAAMAIARVLER